jgi:cell division protein FtsQ
MWDDHRLLNHTANLLFGLAAAGLLYAVLMVVLRMPIFPLRGVTVSGSVAHTTREQVETLAREELLGNFFTVDLEATRLAFEKLPWVRSATARRAWPDRLEVAVEEHVAVARWRDSGLVSDRGEVFEAATDARLPVLIGPEGSAAELVAQYGVFADLLGRAGRAPAEVRLSERRAWELKLDNGDVLELGRQDLVARLARFAAVYQHTVGRLPQRAYRVDLRYPNGFALRQPGLRWGRRPA